MAIGSSCHILRSEISWLHLPQFIVGEFCIDRRLLIPRQLRRVLVHDDLTDATFLKRTDWVLSCSDSVAVYALLAIHLLVIARLLESLIMLLGLLLVMRIGPDL